METVTSAAENTSAAAPAPDVAAVDAVLADGTTVVVRAITAADAERLRAFHAGLTEETTRLRYFAPHPRLSDAEVEHLVNVDGRDRAALLALRADRIVAVARYERTSPTGAEAAFVVADALQGRGVGSLLLEHLAALARAAGIDHLVAETLRENHRMLEVFRRSGLPCTMTSDAEEVAVRLELVATASYRQALEDREWTAHVASIRRMLRPSSVAVVGAGRRPESIGHRIAQNLRDSGFHGAVYPVNQHGGEVAGYPTLTSIDDLPEGCDLAIVAVPHDTVAAVVDACGRRRVGGLVVISSGFAEAGPGGRVAELDLVRLAHSHGMRLVGPNCMGIIDTAIGLDATFASAQPRRGRIGFASQSGAMGIALLETTADLGLGISTFVSLGNKADVSGNDLLRYWYDDDDTAVVLLYLESLGNARAFARIARRVSMRKPIVALKSGRTGAGARAASSHTAALATSETGVETLFRECGVIRVHTLEELVDTAALLSTQPLPRGPRVAVVGNAGGAGILAADACSDAGLDVAELDSVLRARLRLAVSPASSENPVDLGAEATGGVRAGGPRPAAERPRRRPHGGLRRSAERPAGGGHRGDRARGGALRQAGDARHPRRPHAGARRGGAADLRLPRERRRRAGPRLARRRFGSGRSTVAGGPAQAGPFARTGERCAGDLGPCRDARPGGRMRVRGTARRRTGDGITAPRSATQ